MMKKLIAGLLVLTLLLGTCAFFSKVNATEEEENNKEKIDEIIDKAQEIKEEITGNIDKEAVEDIKNVIENKAEDLSNDIKELRDKAIDKLEELENKYGIDLSEYKDRVNEAVENYQNTEGYTVEQLAMDIQEIYDDLLKEIEDENVKENLIINIAKDYAVARAYAEQKIQELKDKVEENVNLIKETYPELEEIDDINDIFEIVLDEIAEGEDAILEFIEDYRRRSRRNNGRSCKQSKNKDFRIKI